MSATRTEPEGRRISVPLDPGLLVEALILKRLDTLPKRRHPDWIRSLLVQGFLAESRVIRQLDAEAMKTPVAQRRVQPDCRAGFDFADWRGRSPKPTPIGGVDRSVPPRSSPRPVEEIDGDKPFAHLRKVVG